MISLLLFALVVVWFCTFCVCVVTLLMDETDGLYIMFNPIGMYNNSKFNIFGVTTLTIINYILFLPAACLFWFYELCTWGRR